MASLLPELLDKIPLKNLGDLCLVVMLYSVYLHFRISAHERRDSRRHEERD